ncbi:MAG TPA: beta-ketoacyl synthase N-terminal-like domain-containing protein, partial [Polyangiaceae bacterium]|nr:beta-ketoacyl synthase N-terminal-like domain-containing protein [Polyangiaceae bacterium]
ENVATLADARAEAGQVLKVIELGAGTGGTSGVVLERLTKSSARVEYVYTDISPGFTRYGARKFGTRHPYVQFRALDVEKEPEAQGYAAHSYDVVFATNVLHATRNIRRSLSHARRLLKPGGLLIVNELTGVRDLSTLTFGLLDGWWLYEDGELRLPHAALLGHEQWAQALTDVGFETPAYFTGASNDPAVEARCFQSLVVAASGDVAQAPAVVAIPSVSKVVVPVVAPPSEARCFELADTICEVVASVIGIDRREIGRDLSFSDFGVDSIMAVDIVERLGSALHVELRASDLFSYSSVNALAAHIAEAGAPAVPAAQLEPNGDGAAALFDEPIVHSEPAPISAAAPVSSSDIAVVGVSGMFPGAADIAEFWANLKAGRCSVAEVPSERWSAADIYDANPQAPGKSVSRWGGFMERATEFDPLFFNMSPKEAELMDPQQRLFLQESYKALEDAGYAENVLAGSRVGVFVGAASGDYLLRLRDAGCEQDAHLFTGNASSILSARIAYYLNLKGPALTVDTACSSSLLALHLACESLRSGSCDAALAGGVSMLSTQQFHVLATKAGMLSPTGVCHAFDQQANGMVPAEACAVFLLKPLSRALADGDRIYGVIRGSGTNQDGKTNGITAPSAASQTALERAVYDRFDIDPATIGYLEAHGTGTKLGDPIEVDALKDAFGAYTKNEAYCALASVKTNVGHPLAAAGAVSLAKVLLSLTHQTLAPSLNYATTNEHIALEGSPFFVNTELKPWAPVGGSAVRRAAVSSFGFSGTNVHVVIDEAPSAASIPNAETHELLCLSARSPAALARRVARLQSWLAEAGSQLALADIAFTLNQRRSHYAHRLALVVSSHAELVEKLQRFSESGESSEVMQSSGRELGRSARAALRPTVEQLVRELAGSPRAARLERLTALGWLYAEGHELDFAPLYAAAPRRVVSLPSYPFLRDRYFVSKEREVAVSTVVDDAPRAALLVPRWEPLSASSAIVEPPTGTFVVLARGELVDALQEPARQSGLGCVFIATSASDAADRCAELKEPAAGRLLACELLSACPDLAGIVDLSDLYAQGQGSATELGRSALLQELLKQQPARKWRFLQLTSGLETSDADASGVDGAWMASLLAVLDAEYGRVSSRSVEVEAKLHPSSLWSVALAELSELSGPVRVQRRGNTRLARRLRRLEAP